MVQHNLPKQVTPFIGREQVIAEIETQLQEAECRLLTLFGLGGIGKTRLAITLGERQLSNFPDGVWFIRLQPVTSSDWIVLTLIETLQVPEGLEDSRQKLLNYLSDKKVLLLLDNFEHLINETGLSILTDVIKVAPSVKFIVTSREALNVQEEWRYSVSGLSIPSSDLYRNNNLETHEATRLFTICAQKMKPNLRLEDEYKNVVKICRLVDGIPLAIEMAASWLNTLSCKDIVSRIERGVLNTRLRNIPDRHRSMSVVFEQSWKLLREDECDVYSKSSVFADGFQIDAAVVVADATPGILANLIDKSLVQIDAFGRYRIHELARQFGADKLAEDQQKKISVLDKHCEYYTSYLNERKDRFRAQDSSEVIAEIGKEIGNIQLAWDHVVASKKSQIIRETIWCLAEFYEITNRYREGEFVLKSTTIALQASDQSDSNSIALGLAYVGRGNLLHYLGQMNDAKVLIRDGVSILQKQDAHTETAHALSLLGRLAWMTGDFELAKQAYRDSLEIAEATGDFVTLGFGYLNLSMIAVIEGNFQQSNHLKQTGLSTFQQISHRLGIGIILCIKGEELYLLGHYDQAEDYVLRAAEIFVELDNRWHLSNCYENLGHIMAASGDYSSAIQHLSVAMELAQEVSDPRRITYCHVNLGDVLFAEGTISEAHQHYVDGLAISQEAHQRLQEAWSLRGLGAIAYHNSNYELAQQYLSDSLNICREMGWRLGMVKVLNLLGLTASKLKEMDSARGYFLEALDTAILINTNPTILETLICIAEMLVDIRQMNSALQILSVCIEHVAIHADTRKRADKLLSVIQEPLSTDIFARLKGRSEITNLSNVAKTWQDQLSHVAQLPLDESTLERLTRTEYKILTLMDSELTYPEIAEIQHVSINTIKTHRKNIYAKLHVNSRAEAVELARKLRLL